MKRINKSRERESTHLISSVRGMWKEHERELGDLKQK
jgi:hypothetical protein